MPAPTPVETTMPSRCVDVAAGAGPELAEREAVPVHAERHRYVADQRADPVHQREVPPAGDVHRRDQTVLLVERSGRADPDRGRGGVALHPADQLAQRGEHLVRVTGRGRDPVLGEDLAVGGHDARRPSWCRRCRCRERSLPRRSWSPRQCECGVRCAVTVIWLRRERSRSRDNVIRNRQIQRELNRGLWPSSRRRGPLICHDKA